MIPVLPAAFGLMASCVVVHAMGLAYALRWVPGRRVVPQRFFHWTWVFVRLAGWIVSLHLIEILIWAVFFSFNQAMPDLQSSAYFSASTYTTTGYGDLVPQGQWRLYAGIESLTGILMCGWSTGFFFAFVSQAFRERAGPARAGSTHRS